ncbi:MAG: ribosome-binding factor A [Gammaproteobacteria bacterium RIFCSPHIGHO2_02_FULL_42_13]|nr:MAG: ribosome-binding factor A [Gammaproteobacteria bacterium RIFCSPHIGHO2_02_FULL_42_13]OGT68832.1 MAG: ribosome-binding factor A [Gammaproteobacteria bacterium RIFCSPLOWO2_02_FULL_42_9]
MSENRMHRVESLIQSELARIIQKELSDPRLLFITVTGVDVTRDLSYAKVYVATRDETNNPETLKILNGAAKFLRHHLADCIELRKIPALHFYYDEGVAHGTKISKLLNK